MPPTVAEAGKAERASADGITFDNIRIAGRLARKAADLNLIVEGSQKGIRYEIPARVGLPRAAEVKEKQA